MRGLRTTFASERGEVRAVDGVDLSLERGRTLGIVGESGCGKSVTALSIMGLVPQPPGRIAAGEVLFDGADLLKLPPAKLRDLRGDKLAMIFQEPQASWGNMLTDAQSVRVLKSFPWMLTPGVFIFVTVLAYNFLGDGLADALNPRKVLGGKS